MSSRRVYGSFDVVDIRVGGMWGPWPCLTHVKIPEIRDCVQLRNVSEFNLLGTSESRRLSGKQPS